MVLKRHIWSKAEVFGSPSDPRSIKQQRCINCGAVRQKRINSKQYGRAWKFRKGSKFREKVYFKYCDGKHGMFVQGRGKG